MMQLYSFGVNDFEMSDLEDLYCKLNGKKSGFFYIKNSSQDRQFNLNFGSNNDNTIADNDIIIIKGYDITNSIKFESVGKNIIIVFINCNIYNSLDIDLASEYKSRNKVGFFYCNLNSKVNVKSSKVGLFHSNFTKENNEMSIKSSISYFTYNKLIEGNLDITSDKVKFQDNDVSLDVLKIDSDNLVIDNNETGKGFNPKKLERKK